VALELRGRGGHAVSAAPRPRRQHPIHTFEVGGEDAAERRRRRRRGWCPHRQHLDRGLTNRWLTPYRTRSQIRSSSIGEDGVDTGVEHGATAAPLLASCADADVHAPASPVHSVNTKPPPRSPHVVAAARVEGGPNRPSATAPGVSGSNWAPRGVGGGGLLSSNDRDDDNIGGSRPAAPGAHSGTDRLAPADPTVEAVDAEGGTCGR